MNHYVGIFNKSEQAANVDIMMDVLVDDQYYKLFCNIEDENQENYFYEDVQYQAIFSGQCYNLKELNHLLDLLGMEQREQNVAEVIVQLFHHYDVKLFEKVRGKFTMLIWDKNKQALYGVRDHFGVNPLYYSEIDGNIIISSRKKALLDILDSFEINYRALQHYFTYQYVPEPMTLNDRIHHVDAGTYFVLEKGQSIRFHRYWEPHFQPLTKDKDYFIEKIRDGLLNQVQLCMDTDKKVGSLLSGGIDSTLIVSLAKEVDPNIKTFSAGFEREGFSEVDIAKQTADVLGIENISITLSPEQYVEKIPEIIWHLEEPLADPSCIPLYFVVQEASKHVDIALSGEGSDELFGGYNIYREPFSLNAFNYVPSPVKNIIRKMAERLPENMTGKSFLLRGTTPLEERYIGNAKMFEEEEKVHFYKKYSNAISYQDITKDLFKRVEHEHPVTQMQYIDINTWLKGDILFKAETMSRANGIEVRMPFMDKEVFEIASEIPVDLKIANDTTKYILREASKGIVPEHVLNRKKLGFPVPIRHWLKNELNSWAKQVIRESEVDEFIHKEYVSNLLEAHCNNKGDYSRKIWTFLILMIWHQVFIEKRYQFEEPKELAL